jgi:hypothetical protein
MFSACANPDCKKEFDYREGHLFRFHKAHPAGEVPPNTHSVQHFWLCGNVRRNIRSRMRTYGVSS